MTQMNDSFNTITLFSVFYPKVILSDLYLCNSVIGVNKVSSTATIINCHGR